MFVLDTHAGFKIRCFLKMCSNFTHRQNEDGFKGSCSENFVIFAEKLQPWRRWRKFTFMIEIKVSLVSRILISVEKSHNLE